MPQLTQLPDIFWSQLFWLAIVFGVIFFGFGRAMLPRIESTVDARDSRIAEDLASAQRARAEADETEVAYRARMDESRVQALRVSQEAKQAAGRETEARIRKADEKIGKKAEAAEAKLRAATEAALADIENVAAEAAEEMVAKLAGLSVGRARAAEAVKAAMRNG
jgi:F-type H+-transporting ATPase subunit b